MLRVPALLHLKFMARRLFQNYLLTLHVLWNVPVIESTDHCYFIFLIPCDFLYLDIILLPWWNILYKGGNFIYPMMHRFILYYQDSERLWSHQFNRDVRVEKQWKASCFADKTFCTFAVSIYLRFFFTIPNTSLVKSKRVFGRRLWVTSLTKARQSTQMFLEASEEGLCFSTSCFNVRW